MLKKRIIPCLDVRDGRVVKGVQFQSLRDAGDPVELASHYQDQGADELVILDVSATNEGRLAMLETVDLVRQVLNIPLTVGGGVSQPDDARRLLNAGADKVCVNSAAVADPSLVSKMAERFGAQCTVVAVDAKRNNETLTWRVVTRSGTQDEPLDVCQWATQIEKLGAGEILLTSFDRDGTRSGYDLKLLEAVTSATRLPVIASGGADSVHHMIEAFQHRAHAVLAASIFHEGNYTVAQVKTELADLGIEVRQ